MFRKFYLTFVFVLMIGLFTTNISANTNDDYKDIKKGYQNNLVLVNEDIDTSKLELLIKIVEKEDSSQYTDESYERLFNALSKAKHLVLNPSTQSEIDQVEADLSIAFKYAEISNIKKLRSLISKIDILNETVISYELNIFEQKSFNVLKGELIGAKLFLQQQPDNQKGANKLHTSLKSAENKLLYLLDQNKDIDNLKVEVEALIDDVNKLHSYDYVRSTVSTLNKAKSLAITSLNKLDQNDVNTKHRLYVSKHALLKTVMELKELETNKLKLETLIKEVENIDLTLYTVDGQEELLESLDNSKQLLKDSELEIEEAEDVEAKEQELEELYLEAVVDLGSKKAALQLIVESEKPVDDTDDEIESPIDSNNSPDNIVKDRFSISTELYLIIAIFTGTLIMISIIGYLRYKDRKTID